MIKLYCNLTLCDFRVISFLQLTIVILNLLQVANQIVCIINRHDYHESNYCKKNMQRVSVCRVKLRKQVACDCDGLVVVRLVILSW